MKRAGYCVGVVLGAALGLALAPGVFLAAFALGLCRACRRAK